MARTDRAALALAGVFVVVLALTALLRGLAPVSVLVLAGFWTAWVVAPGLALRRVLRARVEAPIVELGLALLLGVAALVAAFVGSRLARVPTWIVAWPLATLAIALLARARPRRECVFAADPGVPGTRLDDPLRGACALALVLLLTLTIVRAHDASTAWYGVDVDQLFHAGNTAEMSRPWPALDPRVAGSVLNYHDFSYALPATFARVFEVGSFEAAGSCLVTGLPALLVVLVLGAGVRVGKTWSAGLLAVAFLLAHGDVARVLRMLDWPHSARLVAHQWPVTQLFASWSGTLAVACGLGLAFAVAEALAAPRRARALVGVAAFAFLGSGARGSLLPVVVLAGAAAVVSARLRRRPVPGLEVTLGVILLAAAPKTLALALGADSHVAAMTRVDLLGSVAATPFAAGWFGRDVSLVERLTLLVPWACLWLGVPVLLALVWVASRARRLAGPVALVAVASVTPVLVFVMSMRSQLYFAHAAEVGACVLAAAALAGRERWRGGAFAAGVALALVALVSGGAPFARVARAVAASTPDAPAQWENWYAGASWIRDHAEEGALVAARHPCALVSSVMERRALCDDPRFTPETFAAGGTVRANLLPRRLQDALYADPDPDVLRRIHELAPRSPALYVVLDSIAFGETGPLGPVLTVGTRAVAPVLESDARFTRVFANEAMAVWRVPLDGDAPR